MKVRPGTMMLRLLMMGTAAAAICPTAAVTAPASSAGGGGPSGDGDGTYFNPLQIDADCEMVIDLPAGRAIYLVIDGWDTPLNGSNSFPDIRFDWRLENGDEPPLWVFSFRNTPSFLDFTLPPPTSPTFYDWFYFPVPVEGSVEFKTGGYLTDRCTPTPANESLDYYHCYGFCGYEIDGLDLTCAQCDEYDMRNNGTLYVGISSFQATNPITLRQVIIADDPIIGDSTTWHKINETSKDCSWVGDPNMPEHVTRQRCRAKGDDAEFAFEHCVVSCNTCPRRQCLGDSDTWFLEGDPTQGCAWVAERKNRCKDIGNDTTYAYEACPYACRVCDFAGDLTCYDLFFWESRKDNFDRTYDNGECGWAGTTRSRCARLGLDGTYAWDKCRYNCMTCSDSFFNCSDDDQWYSGTFASDCDWVADSPTDRCITNGSTGTLAYESCPVACGLCTPDTDRRRLRRLD